MHIQKVTISNILGIEHLEFDAGQFNAITGPNGQGKTSVLEAIKATLKSGHDASLLRNGAEKGEVVLVLDNGGTISSKVTAAGTTRAVKAADGKTSAKPANAIAQLTDLLSVNPVDFLLARPADRARALLEAMPITVDVEHLREITRVDIEAPEGVHGLAVIDAARKRVYDDRTGTNRAVKEKDATINQLRVALPDAPNGVEGSEDEIQADLDASTQALTVTQGKIAAQLAKYRAEHDAKMDELRAALDAEKARFADVEKRAEAASVKANSDHSERVAPMKAALSTIRQNREAVAKRQATMDTIATLEKELANLKQDAEQQSQAITAVDDYRESLLQSLPIPGLQVVDGEILRDGVPFDRLNTAQRVQIAVELAKLRAGKLGVCCVDGLEALDDTTFQQFRDAAVASNLQMFVTRVGGGEFAIESAP